MTPKSGRKVSVEWEGVTWSGTVRHDDGIRQGWYVDLDDDSLEEIGKLTSRGIAELDDVLDDAAKADPEEEWEDDHLC
jgi:hypothetical protein